MLRWQPAKSRERFRFPKLVKQAFAFLEHDYGFRVVESDITFVRYENDAMFVHVYHGRASYELGVEIGRRKQDRRMESRFDIQEILDIVDPENPDGANIFQAETAEAVKAGVARLGELLREHGRPALLDEGDIFSRLRELQTQRSQEYQRDGDAYWARREADAAWRVRDYEKVAERYGSVEATLKPDERERLRVARRALEEN